MILELNQNINANRCNLILYPLIFYKNFALLAKRRRFYLSKNGNVFPENLQKVLKRCEEKNLVLNWEKCHFIVTKGIIFGHIISVNGI